MSFTFNSFTEINGNIHCTYISIQYATKKMDTCNSKTTYLTVQKGFSKRYPFLYGVRISKNYFYKS